MNLCFQEADHLRKQTQALFPLTLFSGASDQGGSKNGRRTLKILWEDWYAREISRFVCNKVRFFQVGRLWELYN